MAKSPTPDTFGIAEDIQCPSQPLLAICLVLQPFIAIFEIPTRGLQCARLPVTVSTPFKTTNIRSNSAAVYFEIIFIMLALHLSNKVKNRISLICVILSLQQSASPDEVMYILNRPNTVSSSSLSVFQESTV